MEGFLKRRKWIYEANFFPFPCLPLYNSKIQTWPRNTDVVKKYCRKQDGRMSFPVEFNWNLGIDYASAELSLALVVKDICWYACYTQTQLYLVGCTYILLPKLFLNCSSHFCYFHY